MEGVLQIKPVPVDHFEKAMQMARRRAPRKGARTLEIFHIASALELKAEMFYAFDHNQTRLTRTGALVVISKI